VGRETKVSVDRALRREACRVRKFRPHNKGEGGQSAPGFDDGPIPSSTIRLEIPDVADLFCGISLNDGEWSHIPRDDAAGAHQRMVSNSDTG